MLWPKSAVQGVACFRPDKFVEHCTLLPLNVSGVNEPAYETESGSAERQRQVELLREPPEKDYEAKSRKAALSPKAMPIRST